MEGDKNKSIIATLVVSIIVLYLLFAFVIEERPSVENITIDDGVAFVQVLYPNWFHTLPNKDSIASSLERTATAIHEGAQELKKEFPDSALLPYRFETFFKKNTVNQFDNITIQSATYTGGAHSNYSVLTFVFKEDEIVTLESFVRAIGVPTSEAFVERINENLQADGRFENSLAKPYKLEEGQTLDDLFPAWQSIQNEEGKIGVRIIFPLYSVGPFSEGLVTYDIFINRITEN